MIRNGISAESKKIDLQGLEDFLEKKFPQIKTAYIFGSAKDGAVKAGSDVDIAVLLADKEDQQAEHSNN